ncbi:MAG: class I SAM-dependent DNA methyltransferase [Candidatus Hydrothermarchaeaceae archaeon]
MSQKLLEMLVEVGLEDKLVLDVGCGSGGLTFALSPYAKRVVGIDVSESEIERAEQISKARGMKNIDFYAVDADAIEYREFLGEGIDVVASNLCMSPEIIKRSSRALDAGSPFVFTCFQSGQWKELGGSRFSFGVGEMRGLLETSGFIVEYLDVERWVTELPKKETVELEYRRFPWARRRWDELMRYTGEGGRTLTQSRLVVKARRV